MEPKEETMSVETPDDLNQEPWIPPTFERVPLNEALDNLGVGGDFNGRAS